VNPSSAAPANYLRSRLTAETLLTPLTVLAVTAAVVIMISERSRNLDSVVTFLTFFLTTVVIFAIFTVGLNIQWGYTGVFNFGVMAFFLVGAYTATLFAKAPASGGFTTYVGGFGEKLDFIPFLGSEEWLPFLVGTLAAAVFSGVLAFLVSIPALRLREDYLAIATIGIAELLRRVTIEQRELVNGTRGIAAIPRPLGGLVDSGDYKFIALGIAVVVLILVFIAAERGVRSPWGRVLRALREDELTTAASGKDVFAFKAQGFVLGAVIMGIGGAVFAYNRGAVSPDTFTHFFATFIFWVMLMVGGSGNNKGAMVGAYIVWGFWTITTLLQTYDLPAAVETRIPFMRDFGIGVLIVVVLLLRPQGLLPEQRRVSIWVDREFRRGSRPGGQPAAEPVAETNKSPPDS
jgi:branched-chain amino acid transport system permease protein